MKETKRRGLLISETGKAVGKRGYRRSKKDGQIKGTTKAYKPKELYALFLEYKKYVKEKLTRYEMVIIAKTGKAVKVPRERPLTIEGFNIFLYDKGLCRATTYFKNVQNAYGDYTEEINAIIDIINEDFISGGATGLFNPAMSLRYARLPDKYEVDHTSDGQPIELPQPIYAVVQDNNIEDAQVIDETTHNL